MSSNQTDRLREQARSHKTYFIREIEVALHIARQYFTAVYQIPPACYHVAQFALAVTPADA